MHYTDKPPSKNAKPANLPPLHTYAPPPAPARSEAAAPDTSKADQPANARYQVKVTSPVHESTVRDATSEIGISVDVVPSMPSDYSLVYFVDGAARTDKTGSTATLVTGLERGQHSIQVALYNGRGVEVARSPSVTVYMHQPAVKRPAAAPPRPAPR